MSKRNVIACGGKNPATTSFPFIEYGLRLSGVDNPNIVLATTAASTLDIHAKTLNGIIGRTKKRNIDIKVLHDFDMKPSRRRATDLLNWANVLVVAGDNPQKQMSSWKETAVGKIIHEATESGQVIVVGIEAGFTPWFSSVFSDHKRFENPSAQWGYEQIDGFGVIPAWGCPAYDTVHPISKMHRGALFEQHMRLQKPGTAAIAVDSNVGLHVQGYSVSVISNQFASGLVRLMHVGVDGSIRTNYLNSTNVDMPISRFSTT